jgi:quercetin dioxygenase-like cupin family protein
MNFKSKLHLSAISTLASLALLMPAKIAFADGAKHGIFTTDKLAWGLFDPSQPKGIQIAVLYGDPSKAAPFVVRLKIPAGLELGSHSHSNAELVTVVTGKAKVSWGIKTDISAGDELTPGAFFWMNAGDHHDFKAIDETVIELHSTGPFDLLPDK